VVSNVEDILKEEIKESGELKGKYPYIKVDASKLRDIILKLLKAFDEEVHVITITAVDYPDKGVLELNYELWIYPIKKPLIVKVEVPRDKPEVPSIVDFIPGALFYELEVHDLFGVKFIGNKQLVKPFIISEDLGEATPLRKDWRG